MVTVLDMPYPPPHVVPYATKRGYVNVVRDDLVDGGTKARVIHHLFNQANHTYVYASPVQGYAQLALAYAAFRSDKTAVVFCAKRGTRHRMTVRSEQAGAVIHEVYPGYLNVVRARAASYCQATGAVMLPFGLKCQEMMDGIANAARTVPLDPPEVWCVGGSGTLSLSLQRAWPNASHNVVRIGAELKDVGAARVWDAPEKYEQDAKDLPPFPSCLNYDAKAWRFVRELAVPGALLWNVAGPA